MQVIVIGPNLRDQSKGTFHVHEASCSDIQRDPKRYGYAIAEPHMSFEAETRKDVMLTIYDPYEFDYNPEKSTEYGIFLGDLHFAPCTEGLRNE